MHRFLTDVQQGRQREFREFVARHVMPEAGAWDRNEQISASIVKQMGDAGYLGSTLP